MERKGLIKFNNQDMDGCGSRFIGKINPHRRLPLKKWIGRTLLSPMKRKIKLKLSARFRHSVRRYVTLKLAALIKKQPHWVRISL